METKSIYEKEKNNESFIHRSILRTKEITEQIRKKKSMERLYSVTDTPSLIGFVIKTAWYIPSILWKLRNIHKIESQRFWYLNRNNEAIEGIIYGMNDQKTRPIIAFDSGYKRDLFNFSMVGKVIACLGYRAFSVRSRNELKVTEATDYMDALEFLKTEYKNKNLIKNQGAFIGLSGGNIIVYKACSSQGFVEKHSIKCGVSIAPFYNLEEQFEYMKRKLEDMTISQNTRRILEDYNRYVESLGVENTENKELFKFGSPATFCKNVRVPILIEHGIEDDIVPPSGSFHIYEDIKNEKKEVELVLIPGKGIHGDLKKWRENIIETIGLISSIIYAYSFLRRYLDI